MWPRNFIGNVFYIINLAIVRLAETHLRLDDMSTASQRRHTAEGEEWHQGQHSQDIRIYPIFSNKTTATQANFLRLLETVSVFIITTGTKHTQ